MTPSIVALIPARSGSKRIPHKNIRELGGKPLLAWTIEAVRESGIFEEVLVSTDSNEYIDAVSQYADFIGLKRHPELAKDDSPDFAWVDSTLGFYIALHEGTVPNAFAILRPTSPFRTAETIRRAWRQFLDGQPCDSLRAVEPVKQHPGKMWKPTVEFIFDRDPLIPPRSKYIEPLMPLKSEVTGQPWHSSPTQVLPTYYVQNASLEIAWTRVIADTRTISGHSVMPFLTEGYEGFDINTEEDWILVEALLERGLVQLGGKV